MLWVLHDLHLLAPLQLSRHGDSPGTVPFFVQVSQFRGWLSLAVRSPLTSRLNLPFFFKGMLQPFIVLSLQILHIATVRTLFLSLWHVFNVFSICFMLMLLFVFAYVRAPKELVRYRFSFVLPEI